MKVYSTCTYVILISSDTGVCLDCISGHYTDNVLPLSDQAISRVVMVWGPSLFDCWLISSRV